VPLELHRGLDRLDTLASLRDGLIERGLEPLIGFEQRMPIIRRGDTGAGCQLAPVRWANRCSRASKASACRGETVLISWSTQLLHSHVIGSPTDIVVLEFSV
jgi:hypothetical protein